MPNLTDTRTGIPGHSKVGCVDPAESIKTSTRAAFLRKCIKHHVLLPSNKHRGVDFDLLLVQQSRRINKQLAGNLHTRVPSDLTFRNYNLLNALRGRYQRKFQWLWHKQAHLRKNCQLSSCYSAHITKRRVKNRNDRRRYLRRKASVKTDALRRQADSSILNKSSTILSDVDKALLMKGLNFAPTPNWTKQVKNKEWSNAQSHIRRIEWDYVFKDSPTEDNIVDWPPKLRIPKHSRPDLNLLDDKTVAYTEAVRVKLRALGRSVRQLYATRNNLNVDFRASLRRLKQLVDNNTITICEADKDGKLIIIDRGDYDTIMQRELSQFTKLPLRVEDFDKHQRHVYRECETLVKELHDADVIDSEMLYRATGLKKSGAYYRHVSGPSAKFFGNTRPAFVYPLFKTHKLQPHQLRSVSCLNIPVRLLHAAGNTSLSRFTAMLEFLLNPVSVAYCRSIVNEYCKDSSDYLHELERWRTSMTSGSTTQTNEWFIVAADVFSIYPSLNRDLIKTALCHALQKHSTYSAQGRKLLLKIVAYCLQNGITQFNNVFYTQSSGIITGENHSVSLANIALHYVILQCRSTINVYTLLFKRFIDDIIWISQGAHDAACVQNALQNCFRVNELSLTFRKISTAVPGQELEFLDVLHRTEGTGFTTLDYVKPTASGRRFINGFSHHPRCVYKSIVFAEAVRMRRLNQNNSDYVCSLHRLEEKCISSQFPKKMTADVIKTAAAWTERFAPPTATDHSNRCKRVVWATSFPTILRMTAKEKRLKKEACITYKRPTTLRSILTSYRSIALGPYCAPKGQGHSRPCGKCALCGGRGNFINMVPSTHTVTTPSNKSINLKQQLTCSNYGIYVATCTQCKEQYVGQTKTRFNTRWNAHRSVWRSASASSTGGDRMALVEHYSTKHPATHRGKPDIASCFTVTFVEQPLVELLDACEDKWLNMLQATVNVQPMLLPRVK